MNKAVELQTEEDLEEEEKQDRSLVVIILVEVV
jgi:hypothetical protein